MSTENDTRRTEVITGLRELADFLESRPGVPVPFEVKVAYPVSGSEDPRAEMAAIARAMGDAKKNQWGDYFELLREFSGGVVYEAWAPCEQICERVVVGHETVEVPDPEALKSVPKVTERREKIEWRCSDPLLRPDPEPEPIRPMGVL